MTLSPGLRLGSYEILAPLGAGGMGEVYRARDTKLSREVAIKVLPPAMAGDSASLARFEREAKAVAALSHPNILAIYDFGTSDCLTYAVMELLHGETLRQRLDHGALPVRRAIEIARAIALGLAAAHEKGVVHRDLKPGNLFLTKDGAVKILDFGLARRISSEHPETTLTDRTEPGKVLGTAGYMSPEQVRGGSADHRSDIFSFGAVLYEMLTGKRAFKGETSVEALNAILHEEPPALSETGRPVPFAMERIVAHCLEKQPGDRFQSAWDLAFDLGTLSAATSTPSHAQVIPPRSPWPKRALLAAAAIGFAALGAWAGDRYGPWQRPAKEPTFRRLTFRRGNLLSARFAPDGKTVVYSAAWEGRPAELFSVRTDSIESRPLNIEKAELAAVSPQGELAILLKENRLFSADGNGTLARVPLGGGAARELLEKVVGASWTPDGQNLAVMRHRIGGGARLEYPVGHSLYESFNLKRKVAVSPDGEFLAVAESEAAQLGSSLSPQPTRFWAIRKNGEKRTLARVPRSPAGHAWSPDSREVFFIGGKTQESLALRAVDLSGRERVLLPAVGAGLILHDVAPDGRLLLERTSRRRGLACRPAGEASEREVAWLDGSVLRALSADGRTILFGEIGDGGMSTDGGVYLRRCDGSPAIRLGDGLASDLSPDGKWALAVAGSPPEVWMLPTGPGSPKKIPVVGIEPLDVVFTPDGRHVAIWHSGTGGNLITFMGFAGDQPRTVRISDLSANGLAFSADGAFGVYQTTKGKLVSHLFSGGSRRELPGPPLDDTEEVLQLSDDGRFLFIERIMGMPGRISRRELETGLTSPWIELQPADSTGVTGITPGTSITADGRSYAYSYSRIESSDLFVVDGLK